MRILYFGQNIRGLRCFEALFENGENIVGVVTSPGNENKVTLRACKYGIEVFQPTHVNATEFIEEIRALKADLFVLAGYNQILYREIMSLPPQGVINLHGGKLPEYRGVAPINWQIINGEKKGGCTIIYVDDGIDTGDIIASEEYEITEEDTAATVLEKTLKIFPRLLVETLEKIKQGKVKKRKQDRLTGCYYTRRYPRDGKIKWSTMTAVQVHNLVRALVDPYPGAFCYHRGRKLIVKKTSLLDEEIRGVPGRVPLFRGEGAVAIASDRGLLLEKLAVEGQEVVSVRSYFRKPGEDLE